MAGVKMMRSKLGVMGSHEEFEDVDEFSKKVFG